MSNVLLAEDEFLIRAVVVDALKEAGIACVEAPTGKAALEILESEAPLAAIIVDIGLPDMSGEKVIEAAQQRRPDVPVIRCSGRAMTEGAIKADARVHVFPKPYSALELAAFVASLIAQASACPAGEPQ